MKNRMTNILKVCTAALLLAAPGVKAFSLLGPYTSWQVGGIGYQLTGDIGGPMNEREGFRWNVPTLTYAFDKSFIDYFGPDGVSAIDQAFQHFNDLPEASKVSTNLAEYSQQTLREHYEATALGIMDLKSVAMAMIIEQLGLAEPARWAFTLRNREVYTAQNVTYTNYITIMRNFDPVTLQPSRYVNGTLFTYQILDPVSQRDNYADAIEFNRVGDSSELETMPVAQGFGAFAGQFRTGLTRDDVGGLRFLLHPNNLAVESLLGTVTSTPGGSISSAWLPYSGISNQVAVTNLIIGGGATNFVDVGIRGGRNKLTFKRVFFDSLLGQSFTPITNKYSDVVVGSNYTMVVQRVSRGIVQPDFLFVAEDLGLIGNPGSPVLTQRTGTGNWIDNDAINGSDEAALSHGPGVIAPSVRISFTDQLPYFENDTGLEFLDEDNALTPFFRVWGSFDGSTNAPVLYPVYRNISLQQLRNQILGRSGGL